MSAPWRIGLVVVALGTVALERGGWAQPVRLVKLGYLPVISFAPIFIAIEKGYFEGQGIKVGLEQFTTAAKMNTALAVGELQVASGAASAGLFNAMASGMDFKIVADKGQIRPGFSYVTLVVRKDLLDRGVVRSVADLKGMRISLPIAGSVNHYMLAKMLEAEGVAEETVRLIFLGNPNLPQAFASGAIEAGIAIEPWATLLKHQGRALILRLPEELKSLERLQVAVIIYGGKFISEARPTAERFMKAYLAGVKFHNQRGIKDPEVLEIVAKHTKVPVPTIRQAIPFYLADDGMPILESLADQQDWFFARGFVKQKVTMDRMVDLGFLR